MQNLKIVIEDQKSSPMITLDRKISIDDIVPIDDTANGILWILGEAKGWTYSGNKAFYKLRFYQCDEFKEGLGQYSDSQIKMNAINLWKVYKFEVKKSEANIDKEEELKAMVIKVLEGSIERINFITSTKF